MLAAALFAAAVLPASRAEAGELDGFLGGLDADEGGERTYTWGLEYREPLSAHLDAGFVWLNEGHQPRDHRDGQALQLWWHTGARPRGAVFEAGVGPYRYYDTRLLSPDPDFRNDHGWGALGSASAAWYFGNGWFSFLRVNEVYASAGYDSTSLSMGAGYRFSDPLALLPQATGDSGAALSPWELDALLGERIGNTAHSEAGAAEVIEVRRRLSEHFTASAAFVAGQGTLLDWRAGFAVELWLEQRLNEHLLAGVGAGAFVVSADDSLEDASSPTNVAAMVSVFLGYAFTEHWQSRVVWHRVGTGDDHDCDMVLLGVGYRF